MSLFTGAGSTVATSSDANSMVPLTVVREMLKEVAKTREENLAFRAAVSEHEAANTKPRDNGSKSVNQASAGRAGGRGGNGRMLPANKADLRIKPPSLRIPSKIPKNINSQITWDLVKIRSNSTTSVTGITEFNQNFSLNDHPQASSWQALFDQWCVPFASATVYSSEAPGSAGFVMELHSALDFDNNGNIGSLTAIDDFGTSQVDNLVLNKSVTRSIRPCIKLASGSQTLAVMGRQWCDCGIPGTNWNGIRFIAAQGATVAVPFTVELTIVFAFRNSI